MNDAPQTLYRTPRFYGEGYHTANSPDEISRIAIRVWGIQGWNMIERSDDGGATWTGGK